MHPGKGGDQLVLGQRPGPDSTASLARRAAAAGWMFSSSRAFIVLVTSWSFGSPAAPQCRKNDRRGPGDFSGRYG